MQNPALYQHQQRERNKRNGCVACLKPAQAALECGQIFGNGDGYVSIRLAIPGDASEQALALRTGQILHAHRARHCGLKCKFAVPEGTGDDLRFGGKDPKIVARERPKINRRHIPLV
jgi:hypothetical protein